MEMTAPFRIRALCKVLGACKDSNSCFRNEKATLNHQTKMQIRARTSDTIFRYYEGHRCVIKGQNHLRTKQSGRTDRHHPRSTSRFYARPSRKCVILNLTYGQSEGVEFGWKLKPMRAFRITLRNIWTNRSERQKLEN